MKKSYTRDQYDLYQMFRQMEEERQNMRRTDATKGTIEGNDDIKSCDSHRIAQRESLRGQLRNPVEFEKKEVEQREITERKFNDRLKAHVMSSSMKEVVSRIRSERSEYGNDAGDRIRVDFYEAFEQSPDQPFDFFRNGMIDLTIQSLLELNNSCPNFAMVTESILEDCVLSSLEKKPSPMPIFLLGPAGVGKTNYFSEFMAHLNLNGCKFNLGSLDAAFRISGLNASWRTPCITDFAMITARTNQQTGAMFFDEANKCGGTDVDRTSPRLPVLLSILEPTQAEQFEDNFLNAKIDLRSWFKFLAAPSTKDVPYEILDRCRVVEVSMPTHDQQRTIVKKLSSEMPILFSEDSIEILNVKASSLRTLRNLVRKASVKAIRAKSCLVLPIHARAALTDALSIDLHKFNPVGKGH